MIQERGNNNVINNYKGVMLCSRPNENNNAPIEKPFCGRVYNRDQIGLVPTKPERSVDLSPTKKPVPEILNRHKRWLLEFKEKQAKAKEQMGERAKMEEQKFRKIKQIAENDRERAKKMKNQYNQTANQVLSVLDDSPAPSNARPGQLNAQNLKKLNSENDKNSQMGLEEHTKKLFQKKPKGKPMWAISKEEREQKQEEEVDDLLDFFETNEVEQFSADEQVKNILQSLKQKISQIKQSENWKEKEAERIEKMKQQRRKRRERDGDDESDRNTHMSGNSEARSIASEKTQKKIEELRKKKEGDQDWDKFTSSHKQSFANIEQKIAKNLADEVLRSYPNLKGVHSNNSIRKLIEAEASKAINEPIHRPVIMTIVKEPKPLNTNNLPYLHRNPAI